MLRRRFQDGTAGRLRFGVLTFDEVRLAGAWAAARNGRARDRAVRIALRRCASARAQGATRTLHAARRDDAGWIGRADFRVADAHGLRSRMRLAPWAWPAARSKRPQYAHRRWSSLRAQDATRTLERARHGMRRRQLDLRFSEARCAYARMQLARGRRCVCGGVRFASGRCRFGARLATCLLSGHVVTPAAALRPPRPRPVIKLYDACSLPTRNTQPGIVAPCLSRRSTFK